MHCWFGQSHMLSMIWPGCGPVHGQQQRSKQVRHVNESVWPGVSDEMLLQLLLEHVICVQLHSMHCLC
jgi:hypothetical protein